LALQTLENEHRYNKSILTYSSHPEAIPALKDKGDETIRRLDGDLFFDDTFNLQGRLKNDYGFLESISADKIEKVRCELKKLLDVMKQQANIVPTPYFALLLMDGDRMGRRLSQAESKEAHQAINRSLFLFTGEVRQIVEEKYLGRLVYAGGDDVFALLPVSQALPAANEIRLAFGRHLPGATMSAGAAMAHHLAPLSFVRQQVVEAEKAAKNHYERDALCVTLLKRSGSPLTVGAKWHSCVTDLIADLVDHFRSERLSAKIAFDLDRIASILIGDPFPHEARVVEVRRLLRRHRDNKRCDEPAKTAIDELAERLVVLGPEMADWLKVARFLAGGGRDE
jgi:CRISPR-associated protein Cmr2